MDSQPDISVFTNSLPKLSSAYRMVMEPIWSNALHPARGCELILVVSGEITLNSADGQKHTRHTSDLLLVPPGTMHLDDFDPNEPPSLWFSSFDWDVMDDYLSLVNNNTLGKLSGKTRIEAGRIFELIESDLGSGHEADRAVSASRLHTLLLAILRDIVYRPPLAEENTRIQRRSDIIEEVRRYIRENLGKNLSLDDIADALEISPYYLSHIFHADSGQTLFAYLTELRMARAAKILSESTDSVASISCAVGYQDPNYFSRAFKRYFGHTPSQYRRRIDKDQ